MPSVRLKSYAKLNLSLDVVGKRPDGFHELRTIFERISLADDITLSLNKSGRISVKCNHPHVPTDQRNLVIRIAQQLQVDCSVPLGVDIHIEKNIPVAAGLAGGSSNGATVLMGLNQLWQLKLSTQQLQDYAAWLGSDVAFFLYNTPFALGEGRGERITPIKTSTKLWHVLVTPKVKMLTKNVFGYLSASQAAFKLKLTNKKAGVNILLPFLYQGDTQGIASHLSNDLEPAILSLRPDFIDLKMKLQRLGSLGVCFSGSGPSVYALASNQAHANALRLAFDQRYSQVFVVSTL